MFGYRVFGKGGSNGAISDSIKSKMAADGHLGYTKMAITSQPVCRSTCYLVLGGVFGDGRTNGATFEFQKSKMVVSLIHALLSRVTLASAGLSCIYIYTPQL